MNVNYQPDGEIRIGVSRCLMGEAVRYDGGHKRSRFVTETLAPFVRYIPVCPEVEMGMSTPREAIRLVRGEGGPRLISLKSETDYTSNMWEFSEGKIEEIRDLNLHGYILKKDSPSCGIFRVRVYGTGGAPSRDGRGVFAGALAEAIPDLPMEEEGRLNDAALRENFIERVFAYQRLKALFSGSWRITDLVAFHTSEKLLLLAHDSKTYLELGRLVAGAKGIVREDIVSNYPSLFMHVLTRLATPRKHANVLQHMAGHLKKLLDAKSKAELNQVVEDFRLGLVPLIVPVTLFRHFVRLHDLPYLADQTYLSPHPKELMLRNHV